MHPRPGGANDHSDRAGPSRSGLASRRVVWSAIGASIAIHILAVGLYPLIFGRIDPNAPAFFPPTVNTRSVLTPLIRLVELDETPNVEQPEDPDEIEDVEEPEAEAGAPILEALPGIVVAPPGPSRLALDDEGLLVAHIVILAPSAC